MKTENEFIAIEELDLEAIKGKLVHRQSGKGWTLERAETVEREYRRFLCLVKKFPHHQVAPRFDVDLFWHQHILDTRKYALDCQRVFGYFLHHYPYLGLGGEDDMAARARAGDLMRELYEQTFGESYDRSVQGPQPGRIGDKTAFCTVTMPTLAQDAAFCTVTAEPAFCTVTAEPAFCTVTAEPPMRAAAEGTAFCTVTAEPPMRAATADTAFCTVTAEPAFCTVTAEPAFCTVTADTAFCTVTLEPATAARMAALRSQPVLSPSAS